MRRMKLIPLFIGASLLVACGGAASTDEVEDKPEEEVQEEMADEEVEQTIDPEEVVDEDEAEAPKEESQVESSETEEKPEENLVPAEQNTPEALKKSIEQLDSLNQTLFTHFEQGAAYDTIIPEISAYVTDSWIQEFESSYVNNEADIHNGFFPYRVDNDLNYWFDHQIDGTTATVTTFLHGDDYAAVSVDLDVQLTYEDDRWKIDKLTPSLDYRDLEKGKDFSAETIQAMLEKTTDATNVTFIGQSEEEIFQGPDTPPTIETIYEFEVTMPDGHTEEKYYSAFDGTDMGMTMGMM